MADAGSRTTNMQKTKATNGCVDGSDRSGGDISTSRILHDCLFFTANALARTISRMAEEEFRTTGLSPSHAFLLMLVGERPGTAQKGLGESLQLAPSTVTRLVDTLVHRELVTRTSSGRTVTVFPTESGRQLLPAIHEAWWSLRDRYSAKLGEAAGEELTRQIDQARGKLER